MSHDARSSPRTATMRDVAAVAGVSLKTVSRVVNRETGVSGELEERVIDAVQLLGYRHNLAASSLRRTDGKTGTIGLLLEDVANPYFSALHRAVENVARRHGILTFAASGDADPQRERELLHALASRKVDGLIAVPAGQDHAGLLHEHRLGTPVVFVDRPDLSGVADSVTVDNRAGADCAVRHLQGHGHRRIAYLGDRRDIWTANQRYLGYREALLASGLRVLPELVQHDIRNTAEAEAAATRMLALDEPPSAFFAAQNLVTIGTLRALQRAQLNRTVAVVGFDDFMLANLLEPGITVVSQDVNRIGSEAAELLFGRIAGSVDPPQHVVTSPTLIPRGSGEIAPS
jgi:LacI family transcriptional regulator, galactose operon repressor